MNPSDALRIYLERLGLEAAVVRDTLACFHPRVVRKKKVFVQEGETDARLGFVVDGLFTMEVVNESGRLFIKDFLADGSFLLGSFDPAQESLVTFRALRDSLVLDAPYASVRSLHAKHAAFDALALQGMERRYQALCARLEQMALLDATSRYRVFRHTYRTVEDDIPLNVVAAYLNVTPTQLSRIRRKQRAGLST